MASGKGVEADEAAEGGKELAVARSGRGRGRTKVEGDGASGCFADGLKSYFDGPDKEADDGADDMEERGEKPLPHGVRLRWRLPVLCERDLRWLGDSCGSPTVAVGNEVVISRVGMAAYCACQCESGAEPSSVLVRFNGGCMLVV